MPTLSEKVREIIDLHDSINSKVISSVSSIDKDIITIDKDIEKLMNIYVQCEISGNTDKLSEIEKSVNEAVQSKEKLKFKKGAYEKATANNKAIQDEIPNVLKLALTTRNERFKKIKENQKQEEKLKDDIKVLEDQLQDIKGTSYNLTNKSEARELKPLLKYIETRKVKNLYEEPYLNALIGGCTGEELEQYIEEERFYGKPGPTSIMTNERHCY